MLSVSCPRSPDRVLLYLIGDAFAAESGLSDLGKLTPRHGVNNYGLLTSLMKHVLSIGVRSHTTAFTSDILYFLQVSLHEAFCLLSLT
jgi:hypothetical protein